MYFVVLGNVYLLRRVALLIYPMSFILYALVNHVKDFLCIRVLTFCDDAQGGTKLVSYRSLRAAHASG